MESIANLSVEQGAIRVVQSPVPDENRGLGPGVRVLVLQATGEQDCQVPVFDVTHHQKQASFRRYEKRIERALAKARRVAGALVVEGYTDTTLQPDLSCQ
ncbi:MAG TPA: hypothetical protein VLG37_00210 [Candidatus Saccharimonadales bacterium]|nr:hypothetical protein [Candidatus Saccharimonadales bacterium]